MLKDSLNSEYCNQVQHTIFALTLSSYSNMLVTSSFINGRKGFSWTYKFLGEFLREYTRPSLDLQYPVGLEIVRAMLGNGAEKGVGEKEYPHSTAVMSSYEILILI